MLFRKFSVDFSEKYKTPSIQLDEEARNILVNYPWRGNIRELKNIAEQISVLSSDKLVTANDLKRFLPDQPEINRLPMLAAPQHQNSDFTSERDILYKLFFDMKKDVTEVKKMFFDILQNPNMPNAGEYHADNHVLHSYASAAEMNTPSGGLAASQPIILSDNKIDHHEEVEETLSIADKEKELIVKALKKHKGKRKDAALDLGISERTLYRKLKEYNIAE